MTGISGRSRATGARCDQRREETLYLCSSVAASGPHRGQNSERKWLSRDSLSACVHVSRWAQAKQGPDTCLIWRKPVVHRGGRTAVRCLMVEDNEDGSSVMEGDRGAPKPLGRSNAATRSGDIQRGESWGLRENCSRGGCQPAWGQTVGSAGNPRMVYIPEGCEIRWERSNTRCGWREGDSRGSFCGARERLIYEHCRRRKRGRIMQTHSDKRTTTGYSIL